MMVVTVTQEKSILHINPTLSLRTEMTICTDHTTKNIKVKLSPFIRNELDLRWNSFVKTNFGQTTIHNAYFVMVLFFRILLIQELYFVVHMYLKQDFTLKSDLLVGVFII